MIRKQVEDAAEDMLRALKWEPSDPAIPLPKDAIAGEVLLGEFGGVTVVFCSVLMYADPVIKAAMIFKPMQGAFDVEAKDAVCVQCRDADFARAFGMRMVLDGLAEPNAYRRQRNG